MATNAVLPSGFVRSVLQNGVGRYVCQLQRITLKFCKTNGGSAGMREFIESDLVDFAKRNPGIVVYLKPRRNRAPNLYAEYLNNQHEIIVCNKFTREEVAKWLESMRTKSGIPCVRLRKYWHTDNPSVQGVWTPFTHMPVNVGSFPDPERSELIPLYPSATEQLLNIAAEQK